MAASPTYSGEKDSGIVAADLYVESPLSEAQRDWTDEEEAKLVRK